VEVGGLQSEAGSRKSTRPYLKNKLKQKVLDVVQLERLPSKGKTLSSNPSTTPHHQFFFLTFRIFPES
jgi:hypothetical protein